MIFESLHKKNGAFIHAADAMRGAAMSGASEVPSCLEVVVTPLAAERNCDGIIAFTYDVRVGTSIWEIQLRSHRSTAVPAKVGINGTHISNTLEGRCVQTIVFIRPIRLASGTVARAEIPERRFAPKKRPPRSASETPIFSWHHQAIKLCTQKPPPKESRAKRALSFITVGRASPKPSRRCKNGSSTDTFAGAVDLASTETSNRPSEKRERLRNQRRSKIACGKMPRPTIRGFAASSPAVRRRAHRVRSG